MSPVIADRPWEALPDAVGPVLRDELAPLSDEIIAAIRESVPEYAQPLEGAFGRTVQLGVDEALRQFVAVIEEPEGGRGAGHEVYVNLGRGEMRAGRSLDALLSAYRLGARVAWRRFAAAGERAGLSPRTLYLLAESIFAYIDELSADSIEGYAREQAAAAGAQHRRRRQLMRLLLEEPAAAATAVEAAAADASWPLPRSLGVMAVEGEETDRVGVRVGPDVLVAPMAPGTVLIVPDPAAPGRRRELEAALRGRLGALGPTVTWQEAPVSFARAREVLRLAQDGTLDARGLILADDHGLALLLGADRRLALDVAQRALAPLVEETERSRDRLAETLAAWLRHRGRTEEVARALHVHPQTVRYRLGRLRDLFGDRLEDPDARFELEVALRTASAGDPVG
jgi:PucR-like helix-turn-helix protein